MYVAQKEITDMGLDHLLTDKLAATKFLGEHQTVRNMRNFELDCSCPQPSKAKLKRACNSTRSRDRSLSLYFLVLIREPLYELKESSEIIKSIAEDTDGPNTATTQAYGSEIEDENTARMFGLV
ncbi:hypothetical protein CHS0354_029274 [Potamilus streckersoni]|uniref:Uncharacterized protein n=1 Tax=Potamilus streckersoni TaxID=2493646 RepID=A0AAE0W4R5_9BIVA|nr:hypothetical protein CHS0354_029274 [Potamilus streckersoni]